MKVLPVLDLLGGRVVRGVAGRREEYRPVVSRLTASADPLDVAHAFHEHFGFSLLYVADLEAIAGHAPTFSVYRQLQDEGFRLWVDAGIRRAEDAAPLGEANVHGIIAGLETLAGPETLQQLLDHFGAEKIIFSLDLKNGVALHSSHSWQTSDVLAIAAEAISLGVKKIIILDLAQVGVNRGVGTEDICASLRQEYANIEIITGGGVRDCADLLRLQKIGVDGVLVASALHDGRITEAGLKSLEMSK